MNRRTDNARSSRYSGEQSLARDVLLRPGEEPPLASHLVTARALYSHHGIYIGNGRVIHYSGFAVGLHRGPVEVVSLEHFAHGRGIRIRHEAPKFDRGEVVERARSRLGERHYRLLTNNCEHFCSWALRDESCSSQVERLRALPHTIGSVLRALLGYEPALERL
jgi:Lecithin retinol acyltransferase